MIKNTFIIQHIAAFICSTIIFLAVSSCQKTNYEQLKRPYTAIERFAIAGYNSLDSISGVISGDSIKIYWSADAPRPAMITPNIVLSAGATVSPASGEAVPFSESTVYTVTAEDGTTKEYKLKPVINEAIPVLSEIFVPIEQTDGDYWDWSWGTTRKVKINGQYFLNSNDASAIRVYAQRLKDGYEFDLPVDKALTNATQLVLDLPRFTAEQDSAMHRIWVKVGDFQSNSLDVFITQPRLQNAVVSVNLKEAGQTIYIGDTITFTINTNFDPELFGKYFSNINFNSYNLSFDDINRTQQGSNNSASYKSITKAPVIFKDNQMKFVLTEEYYGAAVGLFLNSFYPHFKYQFDAKGTMLLTMFNSSYDPSSTKFLLYGTDEATRRKTVLARR